MKERANAFLRFVDRYAGIPLLYFFSFFKQRKKLNPDFKKIAFLKTAGIGDTILLSAVIEDVKKSCPRAEITLITGNSNFEAAKLIKGVSVLPLPMTRPLKALKIIRRFSYDLLIDCDPWPRINALFAFFSRTTFTIGFKSEGQVKHLLFDYYVQHSFACHEIENYRRLVRPLGIEPFSRPSLYFPARPEKKCKVALHAFAGGSRAYLKEWPKNYWKQIVQFLIERDATVLLTGSEKDRAALDEFVSSKNVINLAGKYSLSQTASFLKTCACVVSVDTGIMHLAAALEVSVISLHGPTSPKRWGAIGNKVISLTPDKSYTPCIQLGFESNCKQSCCMQLIYPEKVKKALLQVLSKEELFNENIDFKRRQRNEAVAAFTKEIS